VDLERVISKVDSILVAFEPEGVTLAEQVQEHMEAAWGRVKAFIKKATRDSVKLAIALVKSHDPKADLDPVGEGITADCTNNEWKAHFASIGPLAEQIMGQVNL
jgi:hypothetical protein